MNSSSLKKAYGSVYQQFFLENHVVISAPFVMNRSGDVLHNYSGLSIKQQIPLRIYIGYARKANTEIKLNKIYYHDINEHTFIQGNILEYAPYFNDLQKYISTTYQHLCEDFGGIEINILTELPRGVGLGFGSIIPLLLALLLNRFQDTVSPTDINHRKTQNINNLLQDTYSPFYRFFLDALTLDKHMYGMISPGTKLASFFSTYYPVVSFSEDFDKKNPHANIVDNRFFGFPFSDLFKQLREIPYSSIDYGIVYSGKPVMLEQISGGHYKNNTNSFNAVKSCMEDLFGDYLKELAPHKMPRFYKHLILPEGDESELIYGKLMGILSLKIFHAMANMYRDGYDELTMLQVLDVLKKLRQGDCVTRDSSSTYLSFIKHILEYFHGAAKYLALFPNDSTIMGGSTIFATPMEGFRKSILDAVHKTTQQFSGSTLLYTNWIDGLEHDGCIVEQDLKYDLHSTFLESNNCVLRWVNGKVLIADCDSSLEQLKTGLVLDTLHNKIYLDGQRLTSQELHSQTATIEVIKILIGNLGKELSNKQLPVSSYSKNKNEMMSKIVLPLLELIEKRTGKRLPLICKGSLYDFYMKLNKSDVEIVVISAFHAEDKYN